MLNEGLSNWTQAICSFCRMFLPTWEVGTGSVAPE